MQLNFKIPGVISEVTSLDKINFLSTWLKLSEAFIAKLYKAFKSFSRFQSDVLLEQPQKYTNSPNTRVLTNYFIDSNCR